MSAKSRRPHTNSVRKPTQHQRQLQRRRAAGSTSAARPTQRRQPGRPRPLPPGDTLFTPTTGARATIERRSAKLLLVLHQLPRLVVPLAMAGLFALAVLVRGPIGIGGLLVLLAFVGWLSYLSWPAIEARGRTVRLLLLGMLSALLVLQALRLLGVQT